MKNLLNFLIVVTMILISLTYIHEIGHAIFAYMNNCNVKSLIFDNGFVSYTIIACEKNNELIIIGGLILTLLFSFLILFLGKDYFLLSLSLSFLLALEDLSIFVNQIYIITISFVLSFLAHLEFFKNKK